MSIIAEVGDRTKVFICGKWVPCAASYPVINPANELVIGSIPAASKEDVDACIAEAYKLSKTSPWAKSSGEQDHTHDDHLSSNL